MKNLTLISLAFALIIASCSESEQSREETDNRSTNTAQHIIDKALAKSGGDRYNNSEIEFTFRDISYQSRRDGGNYEYTRTRTDSAGNVISDCIDNLGFQRTINGNAMEVPDSLARLFTNSLNSVIYFAMLPYGLNDAAVNKRYIDSVEIKGAPYHKIEVTFAEEGGGEDHEDVFLYWIHRKDFTTDYLAYTYHTDGGGMRFREAYNPRYDGEIRFVDYRNFKPENQKVDFYTIDSLYQADALILLSTIELKNVRVSDYKHEEVN